MNEETSIEGALDKIVYANEENGWSVVRLIVRGRGQITAVGHLLGVQPGESLRLTGRWVRDRKFGEQFRVHSYLQVQPATYVGMEKYLGSGLIQGIGPSMAQRLVQHFGLETLDVIENHPERLAEVGGIGPVRSERIRQAWEDQRSIRSIMIFLQGHGISTTYAVRIYKRYRHEAVAKVRENPYQLARDVYGIGFKSADKIARDLDIPLDSPQRAAAGVLFSLQEAADRGNVYVARGTLVETAAELLELPLDKVEPAVASLVDMGEVAVVPRNLPGPPSDRSDAVFLKRLEVAEHQVAEHIRRLTTHGEIQLDMNAQRAIRNFERQESLELAEGQRQALEKALTSKVLVLTGGPGTGKTTLVRAIVSVLTRQGLRLELAAPTGRAAQRLAEATNTNAKTVHRMLEYSPREGGFQRHADNPVDADLIVVDEASMLDTPLASHVLGALRDAARLVLVGDVDQLPSVGPGRVLGDLIDSGAVEVVRLTQVFRQAQESQIVTNAHRIRQGEMPLMRPPEKGDFFFIEREEPEDALTTLKHLIGERIPRGFGFDVRDIQVLTPMQRGTLGAANINAKLQTLLNPNGKEIARGSRLLRLGDRVMQVRNNYDLEVWNGDVGYIADIDTTEQTATIAYGDREVIYELSDLDELRLAYATSIHKSQGSEYTAVVIPLHTQHFVMLERNLIYTAITRGKKLVVVVGSGRALGMAVQKESAERRATLLVDRLQQR